ncbi:MAG TPA: response regulator [Candidatus Limnocylindria bacterium]|nr:response regulator [Candidatus Limnocylindria bacterium]
MATGIAQRQVRVLLLYAVAALVAMAAPSAWYWYRVTYTNVPAEILKQHDRLQAAIELLRSENAHFAIVLNQEGADPKTARTVEGIDSSFTREIHDLEDVSKQQTSVGTALREINSFFGAKLHPQLQALRSAEIDEALKNEARIVRNDFDILIGRLESASHSVASSKLATVGSSATSSLAITLWFAFLAVFALVIQGSIIGKRLDAGNVDTKAAGALEAGSDGALQSARKRALELENALEEMAAENARLNAALDSKPSKSASSPFQATAPASVQRPQTLVESIEFILKSLRERARVSLSREGRFSMVAQLNAEDAKNVEPVVRQAVTASVPVEDPMEPPAATNKPTILIVDDDRLNRTIFKQVLGPEVDAFIVEAASVDEAWKRLEEGLKPDLIVSDIVMPEKDGFEFVTRLRADNRYKHIEVIMCTAHGDVENITRAGELGIHDYILKPFTKEDVQRLVTGAMSRGAGRPSAFLEAQRRLGLDEESYAQLAEMLSREVADTITFVRTAVTRGYRRAAITRMNSLRGSSQTVGDDGLADAIIRVEKELENGEIYFVAAELEQLEEENARLAKSLIHMRRNAVPPVATEGVNVIPAAKV